MFGVSRPWYVGRNASTSVQRHTSWQYVRHWPSTSAMTMSSRTRHGTARPAAVRVHVVDVLGHDRVVPVGLGQARVVLPPLAVLVVPAGVLVLEPLEVL